MVNEYCFLVVRARGTSPDDHAVAELTGALASEAEIIASAVTQDRGSFRSPWTFRDLCVVRVSPQADLAQVIRCHHQIQQTIDWSRSGSILRRAHEPIWDASRIILEAIERCKQVLAAGRTASGPKPAAPVRDPDSKALTPNNRRNLIVVLPEGAEPAPKNIRLAQVRTAYLENHGSVRAARQALEADGLKISRSRFYEHLQELDELDSRWRTSCLKRGPLDG